MEANGTNSPIHLEDETSTSTASRRPRDARLIHSLLASLGVTSYQERVPLMLIDYAYRYTRSVLADAASLEAEGYGAVDLRAGGGSSGGAGGGRGNKAVHEDVTPTSLRMAVAARHAAQVSPALEKTDLMQMAMETNRVGLPRVEREFGIRLPHERYVLTGGGYGILENWDEEEEVLIESEDKTGADDDDDDEMAIDQAEADDDDNGVLGEEDVDEEELEDVMGGGGGRGGDDEDTKMED